MLRRILFVLLFYQYVFLFSQKTDYFEWGKQIEIISSVSETLLNNYIEEPNVEILTNEAIQGMLKQTDRYTRFYTEQQMFEQRLRQAGKVSGIGVVVKDSPEGLLIREVLEKSPAEKAGLKPGDIIYKVNNEDLKDLNYKNKVTLLKGKPSTEISVKFYRDNNSHEKKVKRAVIEQKSVPLYFLLNEKTGYIKLNRFSSKAYEEVLDALVDLKNQGAEKLILDLRGNPGGLLAQAIKILSLFLPKNSLVAYTEGRFEKFNKKYFTKKDPVDENIPLVILIDRKSASASEIVSGALQDYDRAVIVGDTSFGKGLVQRFFPLKYGTHLKVTISKYFIPSGRQIQKIDYWHRDKNGKVVKYKPSEEKTFYTKNKRKVFDHGGIAPDILIPSEPLDSRIAWLDKKDIIFKFALAYFNEHPQLKSSEQLNDDLLVKNFVSYLKKNKINPESDFDRKLKKLIETAQKDRSVPKNQLNILKKLASEAEKHDLELLSADKKIREQLIPLIKKELSILYKNKTDFTKQNLKNDPVVKKAFEVLDLKKYNSILKK